MEGGGDLPRLVDFLSKSAIFASFIEQNRPIPTTGSKDFPEVSLLGASDSAPKNQEA